MKTIDTKRTSYRKQSAPRAGFTLVELLVVIGIIALLISILLPSLNRAREAAGSVKCLANLKEFGNAIIMYANDNKGFLVPGSYKNATSESEHWGPTLVNGKYLRVPQIAASTTGNSIQDTSSDSNSVFRCPSGVDMRFGAAGSLADPTSYTTDQGRMFTRQFANSTPQVRVDVWYAINGWTAAGTSAPAAYKRYPFTQLPTSPTVGVQQKLHRLNDFKNASTLVLITDGLNWLQQNPYKISARHNGKKYTNSLFADGHAQSLRCPDEIPISKDQFGNISLRRYIPNLPRFILSDVDSLLTAP